jgi:hypothetical protein
MDVEREYCCCKCCKCCAYCKLIPKKDAFNMLIDDCSMVGSHGDLLEPVVHGREESLLKFEIKHGKSSDGCEIRSL